MQELEVYTTVEAMAFPGIYGTLYEGLKRILLNTPHTGLRLEFESFHTAARDRKILLHPDVPLPRDPSPVSSDKGEDVIAVSLLSFETPVFIPVHGNRWLQIANEWFTPHFEDWADAWLSDLHRVEGGIFKAPLWHTPAGGSEPPCRGLRQLLFADFRGGEMVLDHWVVQSIESLVQYPGEVAAFELVRGTRKVYITDESLDADYYKYCVFAPVRDDLVVFLINWGLSGTAISNNATLYQRRV